MSIEERNLKYLHSRGAQCAPFISVLSRYESRPTQVQQIDNYPGGLEQMGRRSPFPTNDSVLCSC